MCHPLVSQHANYTTDWVSPAPAWHVLVINCVVYHCVFISNLWKSQTLHMASCHPNILIISEPDPSCGSRSCIHPDFLEDMKFELLSVFVTCACREEGMITVILKPRLLYQTGFPGLNHFGHICIADNVFASISHDWRYPCPHTCTMWLKMAEPVLCVVVCVLLVLM